MKRSLILSLVACLLISPLSVGCVALHGPNFDPVQQQKDIRFFVQIATRIALSELHPSPNEVIAIKSYLEAGRSLLEETGPDLSGLRELAESFLPEEHRVLGLTVLDVIERYVLSVVPDPNEDAAMAMKLIVAGIDGALAALTEYEG